MKMIQPNELVESKLYLFGAGVKHDNSPYTDFDPVIYLGKKEDNIDDIDVDVFYLIISKEIETHSFTKDFKYDFIFEP